MARALAELPCDVGRSDFYTGILAGPNEIRSMNLPLTFLPLSHKSTTSNTWLLQLFLNNSKPLLSTYCLLAQP